MVTVHFRNIPEILDSLKIQLYYFYIFSMGFISVIFLKAVYFVCVLGDTV